MTDFNEWEQTLFQLILHAGSARSFAKEAAEFAENYEWKRPRKACSRRMMSKLRLTKLTPPSSPKPLAVRMCLFPSYWSIRLTC